MNRQTTAILGWVYVLAAVVALVILSVMAHAAHYFPIDLAISSDNQYLYDLEKKLPGIAAFQIQPDGNLVQIQAVPGTPTSSFGMTGY